MANRRWKCPECDKGRNAPERLRKNDVRRFCLDCSGRKASGPLVEMVCVAVEKRRERKAEQRARASAKRSADRKAQRAREGDDAEVYWSHEGTNLRPVWRALWMSQTMLPQRQFRRSRKAPTLVIRRSATKLGTSGTAWRSQHRVTITIGAGSDLAEVLEVLAHEMAHLHPNSHYRRAGSARARHHGPEFRSVLADLACEVFHLDRDEVNRIGADTSAGYGLDVPLTEIIRTRLASGVLALA